MELCWIYQAVRAIVDDLHTLRRGVEQRVTERDIECLRMSEEMPHLGSSAYLEGDSGGIGKESTTRSLAYSVPTRAQSIVPREPRIQESERASNARSESLSGKHTGNSDGYEDPVVYVDGVTFVLTNRDTKRTN